MCERLKSRRCAVRASLTATQHPSSSAWEANAVALEGNCDERHLLAMAFGNRMKVRGSRYRRSERTASEVHNRLRATHPLRVDGSVRFHELEEFVGIESVSRANQAAAFAKMSR